MKRAYIRVIYLCAILLAACASVRADLQTVMAERNLERRSRLALEYADRALTSAREAYRKGDLELATERIELVQKSVELAGASLDETGKNPRRRPKWFKRAEISIRELLKKLDAFEREMAAADREMLSKATASIQTVHDNLLFGLMEGKK